MLRRSTKKLPEPNKGKLINRGNVVSYPVILRLFPIASSGTLSRLLNDIERSDIFIDVG